MIEFYSINFYSLKQKPNAKRNMKSITIMEENLKLRLYRFFLLLLPGYFRMGLTGVWLSRSLSEMATLLFYSLP
jgi:hypothetical protein